VAVAIKENAIAEASAIRRRDVEATARANRDPNLGGTLTREPYYEEIPTDAHFPIPHGAEPIFRA